MFATKRQLLSGSALIVAAQAIQFTTTSVNQDWAANSGYNIIDYNDPSTLPVDSVSPQYHTENPTNPELAPEEDCCCSAMPCMMVCDCDEEAPPELPPLPPIFTTPVPPPIANSILNMDVILTHIIHTLNPPEVPVEPAELKEFVSTTVTPIVIQLMAKDVAPALPVCTYPDGQSFYLQADGPNPNASLPDPNEVYKGALDEFLANLSENNELNDTAKDYLRSLSSEDLFEDIMIKDENGEDAIEVKMLHHSRHASNSTGEFVDTVTEQDTSDLETRLEDIVGDLTEEANTEPLPEDLQTEEASTESLPEDLQTEEASTEPLPEDVQAEDQ